MTISIRPGTLGELLANANGLRSEPVRSSALSRRARLDRFVLFVRDDGVRLELSVHVEINGSQRLLTAEQSYRPDSWPEVLDLAVDGKEGSRLGPAMERWLDVEGDVYAEGLITDLLDALIPPPPERSLHAWVAEHGLSLMNGDGGTMVRAETGQHQVFLQAETLSLGSGARDLGQVRALVSIEKRARNTGEVVEKIDQHVYWGSLGARGYQLPMPEVASPPLAGWLVDWRAFMSRRLARLLAEQGGSLPMPMDVLSVRSIFNLMRFWLEEGPLPAASSPRLRTSDAALAQARSQVQAIPLAVLRARLRGRGLPTVQVGLSLGDSTIVLCAGTRGEALGDDRILLVSTGEEPITLLRSDTELQSRLKYTIDGDADTMRRLLSWLAKLLVQSQLDRQIELRYAGSKETKALSRWLAFRGDNHDPDEPAYDPRLDLDLLINDHPYWDAADSYLPPLPPAQQERIRRTEVPRYYAFLRRVLDASFVGRLEETDA